MDTAEQFNQHFKHSKIPEILNFRKHLRNLQGLDTFIFLLHLSCTRHGYSRTANFLAFFCNFSNLNNAQIIGNNSERKNHMELQNILTNIKELAIIFKDPEKSKI